MRKLTLILKIPSAILVSMRPQQWVKNTILFAGLIFSKHLLDSAYLFRSLSGFLIFCLLSGSIYIINDIFDIDEDKKHPSKCRRPIASGRLNIFTAVIWAMLSSAVSLFLAFKLNLLFGLVALIYFIQNLLYSRYFKHVVILDVMIVAAGFVLRAIAGAAIIAVNASEWLILCAFLLALFLGFVKRRQELVFLGDNAKSHRKILQEYSSYFLDAMIYIATASTVIAYAFYTMSEETINKFHTDKLILTLPFVLYGIYRYLYLVFQKGEGDNPTRTLLKDIPLQVDIILWIAVINLIIYFAR